MKKKIILALASLVLIMAVIGCSAIQVAAPPATEPGRPTLGLSYTVTYRDAKNKVLSQVTRPAHSYVQGMTTLLNTTFSAWSTTVTITIKDTSNTSRNIGAASSSQWNTLGTNAGAGVVTMGIVAGTGTNTVTESDYALQTLIAHGTGSGQLSYGAMGYTQPATAGSSTSFTMSRTLTNNSGGTITINEVGVYAKGVVASTVYYFCIIRDLTTQSVVNTHNVVLTYTITVSN